MSKPTGNPHGRPRKYATPEEFDAKVDEYVEHCEEKHKPILWTGLALFMGFYGRKEIDEYSAYAGFSHSVRRAKTIVENAYEERLATASSATGPIFALKNMGWTDKQEVNLSSEDGSMTPSQITAEDLAAAAASLAKLI
jgi:hypothetical protein